MNETLANWIVTGLGGYALIGILIGLVFAFGGAGRIDPAAKGRGLPLRARLLIIPGVIGLWPIMLAKLIKQTEPPVQ